MQMVEFESKKKLYKGSTKACTFTDRILQMREVDTLWCMQWLKKDIAE